MIDNFVGWMLDSVLGMITGIALLLTIVCVPMYFLIKADHAEMVKQQCHATGQTREELIMMTVSDGKTTTMIPQWVTEHEYKCNDYNRWR